jgi:hypothetical protein
MNDPELRAAVKCIIRSRYAARADTLVFEELGLRHGSGRVDLAVVNGTIHGFELKSDLDNLNRLPHQIQIYNSVLDKVTLIVGRRHVDAANRLIPDWWGVKLAAVGKRGGIVFSQLRRARSNPCVDALGVAKLLWRDEALSFLVELGQDVGVRSKPRKVLYQRLTQVVALPEIRRRVCERMKCRENWLIPLFARDRI